MPQILTYRPCYLEDYLWNYGFDSGENGIGWEYRDTALRILNKHLKDTEVKAEPFDGSGRNNNCRINFYIDDDEIVDEESYENFWDVTFWTDIFSDRNYSPKQALKSAEDIVKAIETADKEFDEEAVDDLSKVINTPDEYLPLLIGSIKDKEALKLFERLLKGASHE